MCGLGLPSTQLAIEGQFGPRMVAELYFLQIEKWAGNCFIGHPVVQETKNRYSSQIYMELPETGHVMEDLSLTRTEAQKPARIFGFYP